MYLYLQKNHKHNNETKERAIQVKNYCCVHFSRTLSNNGNFCFYTVREGGVQSTLFCIFNHCYFISSQNKLKICHTIKQLYIHNIMPKHENNSLQKKFYNQFKKGTFSVECAHAWGTLDMSMGYTWPVNKKLGCIQCIMFTWYPM